MSGFENILKHLVSLKIELAWLRKAGMDENHVRIKILCCKETLFC
jgi:hypothetical protein